MWETSFHSLDGIYSKAWQDWRKRNPYTCTAPREGYVAKSNKTIHSFFWPRNPLSNNLFWGYTQEIQNNVCTKVFTAAFLIIAKLFLLPKCSSIPDWFT